MSTAIDFGALMRRAKAKKSSASNRASTHEQGSLASSESDCKLVRRPENADSLEREYKVSPEGLERAFYVPNFVSAEEESYLLEKVRIKNEIDLKCRSESNPTLKDLQRRRGRGEEWKMGVIISSTPYGLWRHT